MTPDKRVSSRNTTDVPQPLKGIRALSQIKNNSKQLPLPTYSVVTESLAPAHESCYRVALMLMHTWPYRQFLLVNKSKSTYSQEITQVQWQKTKWDSPGWQKAYSPSSRINLSLHLFLCLTSICKGGYSPHSRVLPVLPRIISHTTGKILSEKSWAKQNQSCLFYGSQLHVEALALLRIQALVLGFPRTFIWNYMYCSAPSTWKAIGSA